MHIFYIVLAVLTGLVVWYTFYAWSYDKIDNTKAVLSTRENVFIFLLSPLIVYCSLIYLIIMKILRFFDED